MIIKYESLQNETFSVFKRLINFINQVLKNKNSFNKKKALNALNSTSFDNLKKKEIESGFSESITSRKNNKQIPFFNLGPDNDWKKKLDKEFKNFVNNTFKKNLIELDY